MPKFKITMPKADEMLPIYAEAADAKSALKKVERLLGPLKGATTKQVDEVPEGETVL